MSNMFLASKFPFSILTDNLFNITVNNGVLNSDDIDVNFSPSDYQKNIFNEIKELTDNIHQSDNDDPESENDSEDNFLPTINCEYYTLDDFVKKNFFPDKNFSILHLNIHSIKMHIGQLRIYLSMLQFNFDIICLSKSKI